MIDIEAIKSSLLLSSLVLERTDLKPSGSHGRWIGLCPFHEERNPSFCVDDNWGRYRCFSCGEKGDQITFLQKSGGMDFSGALKAAAVMAGVETEFLTADQRKVYEARSKKLAAERKAVRDWKKELRDNLVVYTNAQWKMYRTACRQLNQTFTDELEEQSQLAYNEATRREQAMDELDSISDRDLAEWYRTRKSWSSLANPVWCLSGNRLKMVNQLKKEAKV